MKLLGPPTTTLTELPAEILDRICLNLLRADLKALSSVATIFEHFTQRHLHRTYMLTQRPHKYRWKTHGQAICHAREFRITAWSVFEGDSEINKAFQDLLPKLRSNQFTVLQHELSLNQAAFEHFLRHQSKIRYLEIRSNVLDQWFRAHGSLSSKFPKLSLQGFRIVLSEYSATDVPNTLKLLGLMKTDKLKLLELEGGRSDRFWPDYGHRSLPQSIALETTPFLRKSLVTLRLAKVTIAEGLVLDDLPNLRSLAIELCILHTSLANFKHPKLESLHFEHQCYHFPNPDPDPVSKVLSDLIHRCEALRDIRLGIGMHSRILPPPEDEFSELAVAVGQHCPTLEALFFDRLRMRLESPQDFVPEQNFLDIALKSPLLRRLSVTVSASDLLGECVRIVNALPCLRVLLIRHIINWTHSSAKLWSYGEWNNFLYNAATGICESIPASAPLEAVIFGHGMVLGGADDRGTITSNISSSFVRRGSKVKHLRCDNARDYTSDADFTDLSKDDMW